LAFAGKKQKTTKDPEKDPKNTQKEEKRGSERAVRQNQNCTKIGWVRSPSKTEPAKLLLDLTSQVEPRKKKEKGAPKSAHRQNQNCTKIG